MKYVGVDRCPVCGEMQHLYNLQGRIACQDCLDRFYTNVNHRVNEYLKNDNGEFSDNRMAIKMLGDVTEIISAIESNSSADIKRNLRSLKIHMTDFEDVYYENKSNGCY